MASGGRRDAAFTQFVRDRRPMLVGAAYLMFAQVGRAEDVVQACLAELYRSWPDAGADLQRLALRDILTSEPGRLVLPWQRVARVELLDKEADLTSKPVGIVAELADLSNEARRVIILQRYVGLPSVEVATVLQNDIGRVRALAEEATALLGDSHSGPSDGDELAGRLRAAVPNNALPGDTAALDDLAHGRLLVRRRRLRKLTLAAAVLIAAIVGLAQLSSAVPGREAAVVAPTPVPISTPTATASCDVQNTGCRVAVLGAWRRQMAGLTSHYLDPEHSYFSGDSRARANQEDSNGFWSRRGGVLELDMAPRPGATEVSLQIATPQKYAVPCGSTTHQACSRVQLMDGNSYTFSETTDVAQGIEIQFSASGDEVITVVARNTSPGRQLDVTLAQLISLVTDPRLRLPPV